MDKPTIQVVAGIIWRGDYYLAVQRPEGMPMAGWWEFPGGKVEPGEAHGDALVRELREELGIGCSEYRFWRDLIHEYERFFVHLHFFHVTDFSGEPKGLEGQSMQWMRPLDSDCCAFLPADVPIVEALKKERP